MAEALQYDSTAQKYIDVISTYDKEFDTWEARSKKIIERYRDDSSATAKAAGNEAAKFNILWANVQTLIPAVYARMPKADVSRRFSDNDPVGRVASLLIERALDYEIEHFSYFRSSMRNCVEDRFLGGRGVSWVRYDPHVVQQDVPEDGAQITEDVTESEGAEVRDDEEMGQPIPEKIDYECSPADYVHWKDFGHTKARTWEEVWGVYRWVYLTKEALDERFPDKADQIPLDSGPEPLDKTIQAPGKQNDRAKICEFWDKERGKVIWLSKSLPQIIEEMDDPLHLEGFFPCAKPLYATTTSDSLVPVPDFVLYQDQAKELDILSDRIDGLVKALRVRGVYDQSQPNLQRLLTEGDNNTLVPVDKWQQFAEKGGLKGTIDLLPIDMIAEALVECYKARDDIKNQIYEITGIADIIRGQTEASETATAQQIKGQYAGLRLRSMQESVALFASEILRLMAQIICTRYQDQTILAYAAADQLSEPDKALVPQALQLLRNKPLRSFRIEVASDSLVQIDENQAKQDRVEFLTAMGGFLKEALPVGQTTPALIPLMAEMLKYGVRGFKQARTLEGQIDQSLEQMKQMAMQKAQQPPPPDPEMVKAQMEAQNEQRRMAMDAQAEQMRAQVDMRVEQMKAQFEMQLEQQRQAMEERSNAAQAALEARMEWMKAQLDAATKITVAGITAQSNETQAEMAAENEISKDLQ